MKVKSNCSSPRVNQAFTVFSKSYNSHSINKYEWHSFFRLLNACSLSVCVNCMRDVFSNKQIKINHIAVFLGMISKTKTVRHTSDLQ